MLSLDALQDKKNFDIFIIKKKYHHQQQQKIYKMFINFKSVSLIQ